MITDSLLSIWKRNQTEWIQIIFLVNLYFQLVDWIWHNTDCIHCSEVWQANTQPRARWNYLQRLSNPTTAVSRIVHSRLGHVRIQNWRKDRSACVSGARAGNRLQSRGRHYLCGRHGWQSLQCPVLGSLILPKPTSIEWIYYTVLITTATDFILLITMSLGCIIILQFKN